MENGELPISKGKSAVQKKSKLKCPDIHQLSDYSEDPGENFWRNFPSLGFPDKPQTKVNVQELESMVKDVTASGLFSPSQTARAYKVLENLREGAPSHQKLTLPGCYVENAKATIKYGREVTDTVAYWVQNKFVVGPFDYPPLPKFRVNPIVAVVQDDKVRPVLNVSSPDSESFNSNIEKLRLEKIKMSSARNFRFKVRK